MQLHEQKTKSSLLGGLVFLGIGILSISAYFIDKKDTYSKLFNGGLTLKKTSERIPQDEMKS